jgi:hypothetical protein
MKNTTDRDKNIFNAVYDLIAVVTIACSIGGIILLLNNTPFPILMAAILCGATATGMFMIWLRGKIQQVVFGTPYV